MLYRTAEQTVNRDMHLLRSSDHGNTFSSTKLDAWEVPQCVMSSAAILASDDKTFAAWETESQVRFARIDDVANDQQQRKLSPMPTNVSRKHPVLAMNSTGHIILVWTEGTGWQRGGALAWQVFDPSGNAMPGATGTVDGVPVWSFAAVFATGEDRFTILY